jgi:hypothetical protein
LLERGRGKLRRGWQCFAAVMHKTSQKLALAFGLLCSSWPAFAQTDEFLPEIDLYSRIHHGMRFQFQASQTREANEPVQASFGPSINFSPHPLHILTDITKHDLDEEKKRLFSVAIGYRYLPAANGGASTNRIQTDGTLRSPASRKLLLTDRNRFEFNWKNHGFTWEYRNRIRAEGPIRIGRYHPSPYASVEFYYESEYGKFADTAIEAGCIFPIKKHVQLETYYEHQNETGKHPNQQLHQLGVTLNIYF